jgi:hypothetical protein
MRAVATAGLAVGGKVLRAFSFARAAKKRRTLTKLYATTFFSDSPMTRVDGATDNTLGFK